MQRSTRTVLGVDARAPRPTALGAALVAGAVCAPLLIVWGVLTVL